MTLNNSEELVQAQYEIEKRYSNNQLIPRLKRELKRNTDFNLYITFSIIYITIIFSL